MYKIKIKNKSKVVNFIRIDPITPGRKLIFSKKLIFQKIIFQKNNFTEKSSFFHHLFEAVN